jgi:hypothetical protein
LTAPAHYEYSGLATSFRARRAKTMIQHLNSYRYDYYYGSLSTRRDGAAMGCPGVSMI